MALFDDAIKHFWKAKGSASVKRTQGGSRDENLGGSTMDGFASTLREILINNGVPEGDIYYGPNQSRLPATLPGFFRATKNWDLIVCKNSPRRQRGKSDGTEAPEDAAVLLAAIEFKSQKESIGNNQNNRIEESIGCAIDFWHAYENKLFNSLRPRPWVGYLFVGKYSEGADSTPIQTEQPHFDVDPVFLDESCETREHRRVAGKAYASRYKIFFERMIGKKLYDSACFLVTDEPDGNGLCGYRELFDELSADLFVEDLLRHIAGFYKK